MDEHSHQEENINNRLRLLMLWRLAIATFLLAMAGYFRFREDIYVSEISQSSIFFIIFLTYILSIFYLLLLKIVKNIELNIYIQSICDVLIITGLVYFTGGIRSIYSVFYPLVIIYSVLFLSRSGGLIIASACGILYGILINLEYYGIIYPMHIGIAQDYDFSKGYIFSRVLIHILSFYIIAFLASFFVEQEKKARALLEEKENAFEQLDLLHKSIIESIDAGILTVNLQKNIKSFNKAAEEITGFPFSEIANRNIEEIFPGYSKILDRVDEKNEKSSSKRVEMTITGKGGKKLTVGCSISPLNDHRSRRIGEILIFQDLSTVKMMEEALGKSRRLAFIGEMAAGLAHEMRNPMASISGSIQLLKRDLHLNEADDRLMQIILRGKDQLENFIKDFLLMARPAAGIRDVCDVNLLIEDVIEAVHYIPEWNDQCLIKKELAESAMIHANKTEIRQVIWNLVVNAVQAMPDGGTINISAKTLTQENFEDYLEIKIADTGDGISEDGRAKIFEPFYTTKDKGTGLGLAIVNRIIEGYKGKIMIDGEYQKGAAFIVSLPTKLQH